MVVEHVIKELPGVIEVYVNPATETAYVDHEPGRLSEKKIARTIKKVGYKALLRGGVLREVGPRPPSLLSYDRRQRKDYGMFKWLLIVFVVLGVGLGLLAIALASSGDSSPAPVDLDVSAIRELASAATQDAENMERHAQTMASIAATRSDHAHWASDAELARANARSLRFVSESAQAIVRDEATFPVTASSIQLDRLLGNGLNLQGLGRTVVDHATAMESHIEVMREQAAGDVSLLSAISDLSGDVQRMKADGTAAVNHGKVLEDKARTIARSIGADLD